MITYIFIVENNTIKILYVHYIMVLSYILREEVLSYPESNELEKNDSDHESALYRLELIDGKEYVIALGTMRTEHIEKGAVYFPIYLVKRRKSPQTKVNSEFMIESKIGVFEIESERAASIQDIEDDIDIEELDEPLLFSFVTPEYLEKHGLLANDVEIEETDTLAKDSESDEMTRSPIDEDMVDVTDELSAELEPTEDDEDEMFQLEKNSTSTSTNEDTRDTTGDNIEEPDPDERIRLKDVFKKDDPLPNVSSWPAETEEYAKKQRREYRKQKSIQDNWVVQFMNNKDYRICPVEGNGDCFFACVRDAYAQIGHRTTTTLLRKYLSQEVTVDLYENYKNIYDGIVFEQSTTDEEVHRLENVNNKLKTQSKHTKHANQQKEILNEAIKVKQDYSKQKMFQEGTNELLNEFGWMKHVSSIEDLMTFVQTSEFWADTWAISTLELLLSMKILVLENTNDIDSVLRCTQQNDNALKYEEYNPMYYIVLAHTNNNHYELISYKEKRIFTFAELPYDMKVKVVRACIENNDNSYYAKIPDFRQFRYELGIADEHRESPNEGTNTQDKQQDSYLFDPSISVSYHNGSDCNKKVGYHSRDNIPTKRLNEFSILNHTPQWRKQLDDDCCDCPFTMNNTDKKRWNSVSHFLLALPFKESNPAIYEDFSDDSKSELSKDIGKARQSIQKKKDKVGKYYQQYKEVTPMSQEQLDLHRKDALREKFHKDTPTGRLLQSTNYLLLNKFQRNKPPYVDVPLMEIRREVNE